jgi:hypothetical protein
MGGWVTGQFEFGVKEADFSCAAKSFNFETGFAPEVRFCSD